MLVKHFKIHYKVIGQTWSEDSVEKGPVLLPKASWVTWPGSLGTDSGSLLSSFWDEAKPWLQKVKACGVWGLARTLSCGREFFLHFPPGCTLPYCLVLFFFISLGFTVNTLDCELRNGPVFSLCLLRCLEQVADGFVAVVIFHVLVLKLASGWACACPVTSSVVLIDLTGSYLWREATATWCRGVNLNGGFLPVSWVWSRRYITGAFLHPELMSSVRPSHTRHANNSYCKSR